MTTRHRPTLSIRATLLAIAVVMVLYVGVIGAFVVLRFGPSAAEAMGVWAMVGLVLLIGMALVIYRRLHTPFSALDQGLARVARGDLETFLPVQREDELGRLTSRFNQMTKQLRVRASDAQLQTAQLAERFGRIFEHSFNDIYVFDARTLGLLQMNRCALSKLGYEPGHVESVSVLDLLEGYDEAAFRRLARPLERDEQPGILFSATHVRNDGTTYPVDITLQLWKMEEPAVFVAIAQDVTERRRGEMIRVAAQRIAEIALTAPTIEEMFYQIHNVVGELMPARNFYLALYDALSDTISFPYFVDEEDDELPLPKKPGRGCTEYVLRTGKALLLTEETFQDLADRGEVILLGPQSADWLGVPLVVGDKVIGVLAVQSYGSSPRHTEADLGILEFVSTQVGMAVMRRQAEQQSRVLVDGAKDLIFALSRDGLLTTLNPAFEQITGFSRQDWLGRPFVDLLHHADGPRALAMIHGRPEMESAGHAVQLRLRTREGGYRIGEFQTSQLRAHDSIVGVLGVVRDITDRVHLEDQVRHAQKMESIGRLAGGVAHDFNNLLTVMLGFAGQAKEGLSSHDPARADLAEVEEAGAKAASLTRQLLAFARRQVTEPRLLDLNAVTFGMDKMLRRLIGEDIQLVTRLGERIWTVSADLGQIEQVIVNLAVNARDAMTRGGTLTIETANVSLDSGAASEDVDMPPGQYVLLTVGDTGHGMSVDVQEHIFEPFFTTKEMGRGTGLGLATCYGIVKQAGGWIWVSSDPGRGTSFKIYLPRVDAAPESMTSSATMEALDGTERVLLVEDEESVRRVAARALRRRGYDVTEASNGQEALELIGLATVPFDLVLTDIVMPVMGGHELAERLLATGNTPGPKILFTSGYTDDGFVHHGVQGRNIAFLAKPYDLAVLARKVRTTLDG